MLGRESEKMRKLVILGAGGHAREQIELIHAINSIFDTDPAIETYPFQLCKNGIIIV